MIFSQMEHSLSLVQREEGQLKQWSFQMFFFGMVSGSTTASVMTTGVFTIPMMKKVGYSSNFAGAVEAVSSNGAQIMPPVMGAVIFIICEILSIPYREVVLAAIIPALYYHFMLFITLDFNAGRRGLRGLSRPELPRFWETLKGGILYLVPVVALVVFLVGLRYSPEGSSLYSIATLLIIGLFLKGYRMGPGKILHALEGGARGMVLVTSACATAGIIIGCISLTGLGIKLSTILLVASQGKLFLLLLFSAIACYILGMGMSSIPVYLTVAITVGPALIKFGLPPLAAHLYVFWWALTSFITPPVAIAAYAAAGISGGDPFRTGFEAMRLGAGLYILPFMFIYQPGLLLMGTPGEIVLACITCLVGVVVMAGCLNGYLLTMVRLWERFLLGLGAILLIFPGWASMIGLVVIFPVAVTQIIARQTFKKARELQHG